MFSLTESDIFFHRQTFVWSGSSALHHAWNPLYGQIQLSVDQTHSKYFESLTDLAEPHNPIIKARRSGQADEALQKIRDHVMLNWPNIEQTE